MNPCEDGQIAWWLFKDPLCLSFSQTFTVLWSGNNLNLTVLAWKTGVRTYYKLAFNGTSCPNSVRWSRSFCFVREKLIFTLFRFAVILCTHLLTCLLTFILVLSCLVFVLLSLFIFFCLELIMVPVFVVMQIKCEKKGPVHKICLDFQFLCW